MDYQHLRNMATDKRLKRQLNKVFGELEEEARKFEKNVKLYGLNILNFQQSIENITYNEYGETEIF